MMTGNAVKWCEVAYAEESGIRKLDQSEAILKEVFCTKELRTALLLEREHGDVSWLTDCRKLAIKMRQTASWDNVEALVGQLYSKQGHSDILRQLYFNKDTDWLIYGLEIYVNKLVLNVIKVSTDEIKQIAIFTSNAPKMYMEFVLPVKGEYQYELICHYEPIDSDWAPRRVFWTVELGKRLACCIDSNEGYCLLERREVAKRSDVPDGPHWYEERKATRTYWD